MLNCADIGIIIPDSNQYKKFESDIQNEGWHLTNDINKITSLL